MNKTPAPLLLLPNNENTNKGDFTENFVCSQMQTLRNVSINYYSKENSQLELDFVIQLGTHIYPIEVKAEENVKSKSLAACITHDFKDYNLHGIRFSMKGFKEQDWMTNIPLYSVRTFIIKN